MDISELKSHDAALEGKVQKIYTKAEKLGAIEGLQRLALVSKYFKKLSIEEAYSMLDSESLQHEVEKAQALKYKVGFWRVLRNGFSLFPLILTWYALYQATNYYQQDLANPKYEDVDQYQPFLRLWQEGFHGATWLTFANAALIDVGLLLTYLFLILFVAFIERLAQRNSNRFAQELQEVTNDLIKAVAEVGPSAGTSDTGINRIIQTIEKVADEGTDKLLRAVKSVADADVDKIVQAIKQVLDDALMSSDQVAQEAREFIEKSNEKMEDMFNTKVKGMLDQFHRDQGTLNTSLKKLEVGLSKLSTDLVSYDKQLKDLTDASSKLAGASSSLATNTNDLTTSTKTYASVGQDIQNQLGLLNTSQQKMVTEIETSQQKVVTEIGAATGSVNSAAKATESVAEKLGQITKKAQEFIEKSNEKMEDMFNTKVKGMLDQFHSDLGTLNTDLKELGVDLGKLSTDLVGYDKQLKDITDASSKLAGASSSLATNANDLTTSTKTYASVGQDIQNQLGLLNTSQQKMVIEIGAATDSVNSAAKATESVAEKLGQITKKDIEAMAKQVIQTADRVANAADTLLEVKGSLTQVNQQLQGSVSQVDEQLRESLSQLNLQLQETTKELHSAAKALANTKSDRSKRPRPQPQTTNPQPTKKSLIDRILRRH